MGTSTNAVLGGAFLLVALFLTFLMYYLWGFPFDKQKHRSSAPRSLMTVHRAFGYVFIAIYIVLMWEMVPRLWTYQVELPARTVIHLTMGIAVGAILIIKISIVRFFKHLESTLAPLLGTALLICTLLLTGLALPFAAREAYLRATAQEGQNFSEERIARVEKFLPLIGFEDTAGLEVLASSAGLAEGRDVLTYKCTQCHDLRTILITPRTPEAWHKTVMRMANRASTLRPITESEQWSVTAYLIAITPTLRKGVGDRLTQSAEATESREAIRLSDLARPVDYSTDAAETLFETKCSQCHSPLLVENAGLQSHDDAVTLVTRMIGNGLTADQAELSQILAYLSDRFAVDEP
ncbi:hypothetical protein [Phaeobacter sp. C3_T13_0]|uniref:hypothetical protein n=1 Tax=Phaeobacter cretensis TaxID=3342641 RepID=UPI0039BCBC47